MDLESIKLKIRKNKDIIYTNGYGVLVFILWDLIKIVLYSVDAAPDSAMSNDLDTLYLSLFSSVLAAITILTAITGFMAIRVGKKNSRHRIALIVLSIITCLFSVQLMVDDIYLCMIIASYSISIYIVSILTDIFFFMMTLFLTISSFKLNRLRKLEKEANTNER